MFFLNLSFWLCWWNTNNRTVHRGSSVKTIAIIILIKPIIIIISICNNYKSTDNKFEIFPRLHFKRVLEVRYFNLIQFVGFIYYLGTMGRGNFRISKLICTLKHDSTSFNLRRKHTSYDKGLYYPLSILPEQKHIVLGPMSDSNQPLFYPIMQQIKSWKTNSQVIKSWTTGNFNYFVNKYVQPWKSETGNYLSEIDRFSQWITVSWDNETCTHVNSFVIIQ